MTRLSQDEDTRTGDQREWADWSRQGYRKFNQPRSVLRVEFALSLLLVGLLLLFLWLLAR